MQKLYITMQPGLKSQIPSTKFFTLLNNSINSVTVLVFRSLCRPIQQSLHDDLAGQVNLKLQYLITKTGLNLGDSLASL